MSFASENAKQAIKPWWWVAIEGIRRRRGTHQPGWNPADTGMNRHIDLLLATIPKLGGQEVDPLNGTCTVANHSFDLHDVDGEITSLLAVSDTPKAKSFLTSTVPKTGLTHISVDDFSSFAASGHLYIERETFYYTTKTTRLANGKTADELVGQTADANPNGVYDDRVYDAARTEDNDYWLGGLITFTGGANNGQSRRITRFVRDPNIFESAFTRVQDGQENTLYLEPDNPLPNNVAAGDTYDLHYSPTRIKDAAALGGADYWLGARMLITADGDYPENVGELRWVKSWDEVNKVFEFYEPLPGPTGATTVYSIALYAFTTVTRALYDSIAAEHSVLDEKGGPIPIDVLDAPPFIKSRRVRIYENRAGCVEVDAKLRVGSIDDYVLSPSGEVFSFTVSGIMRLIDNKVIAKQHRAKVAIKPVWGGRFHWRQLQGGGAPKFFWPVMSDSDIIHYSVTEIFADAPPGFTNSGNLKIGKEIIHYTGIGISRDERLGIGRFFKLAENHILFDKMGFHETWDYVDMFRQHGIGTESCAAGRGMFAEKIGVGQIQHEEPPHIVKVGDLNPTDSPAAPGVNAFMEEHFIGDDIVQVCVCDDSTRSDFPRYDVIRYSAGAGALTIPATLTGGWHSGTATAVAHDATNFLITVHSSSDEFVYGEALFAPGWSCVVEEITLGDGVDLPTRNNPLTVLLQLLMSTGDGTNGEFDTLPDGWGLGFDSDMVDVDGIKLLRDTHFPTTKVDFVLHEPVSLRELVEKNLYRFLQIFPFETTDGKYSLAHLLVEDEARELDDGSLFEMDGDHVKARGLPDWTSGSPPVTKVKVKYNKDPVGDNFYGSLEINFKRSQSNYQELGETVAIESGMIYLSKSLVSIIDPADPELPEMISRLLNPMYFRHSRHPAPRMMVMCPFQDAAEVEIGNVVKFTHPSMPNLRTGLRGLSGEYCQVLGVTPSAMGGEAEFLLWQVGIHDNKYSRKPPSALVVVYAADTPAAGKSTITIQPTWFNLRYGIPRADRLLDRDDFVVGDEIMIMSPAWVPLAGAVPEHATIEALGSGADYKIILDQNLANVPSLYDIVELAKYDDNTSTRKSMRVFLADEDRWLGAANDSAFKYK